MVDIDVRVSSYLKEELAWAVGKRLRIISTIILFKKTVRLLGRLKELAVLNYCICCYVALSNVFRDSIYCDLSRLSNVAYFRYVSL